MQAVDVRIFDVPARAVDVMNYSRLIGSKTNKESFLKWASKDKNLKITKINSFIIQSLFEELLESEVENRRINNKKIKMFLNQFEMLFTAVRNMFDMHTSHIKIKNTQQHDLRSLFTLKKIFKDTNYLLEKLEGTLSEQKFKFLKTVIKTGHKDLTWYLDLEAECCLDAFSTYKNYRYYKKSKDQILSA